MNINKLLDVSKYYKNIIKGKKDIESYINKSKKLQVLSIENVDMIGNVYTEERFKELQEFYEGAMETTCKKAIIKIIDNDVDLTNDHIITIYYNNIADLDNKGNFYDDFGDYKQTIYRILY